MALTQDRRREQRVPCFGLIEVFQIIDRKRCSAGGALFEDFSTAGAGLVMDTALEVETSLVLKNRLFEVDALVRHCVRGVSGFRIGVEFIQPMRLNCTHDELQQAMKRSDPQPLALESAAPPVQSAGFLSRLKRILSTAETRNGL